MSDALGPSDTFIHRHIGPSEAEIEEMLAALGLASLDELVEQTVPEAIRLSRPLEIGPPRGERELLEELRAIANENKVYRSLTGMGYYDCITPPVIQRNILENPGWYTQYTPYQAEISQGRLEALLNFQTMVVDLTGLPLANASLLDEATAAAEALTMCSRITRGKKRGFFVADDCHPQTIAVVQTRAKPLGIELHVGPASEADFEQQDLFGVLLQYPATDGVIRDYSAVIEWAHAAGALAVVATDLLALTLIKPPGEFGADIAVGSAQRFGVPLGFGGPHAAFLATHEKYLRQVPGRVIGVSKDAHGNAAYRLAVQTREQHIRREKATSNICTAQVLLAIMAGMYAVYHGPDGLRRIAERVNAFARTLAGALGHGGHEIVHGTFFDTIRVRPAKREAPAVLAAAERQGVNLRDFGDGTIGISTDETTTREDIACVVGAFSGLEEREESLKFAAALDGFLRRDEASIPAWAARQSAYLEHPVFHRYQSEHEMLRYINRLQSRDLSLTTSMIPLGSCTMKLNGTSEMLPITWPQFADIHPFAPLDQTRGYHKLFHTLSAWLAQITRLPAVSLQPNAGAQGEYAGLLVIRAYHERRGAGRRDVCLIPMSAHGTNPASAIMAGMRVVPIACDERGNIDLADLKAKSAKHKDDLAALMVTYPSTHGVFEEGIREICGVVHASGGQVYMDGANLNAQCGLCAPGEMGADVCHLNLHKTFCIPHGGGGPGMGPIAVAEHLAPFLPGHPVADTRRAGTNGSGAGAAGSTPRKSKISKAIGPVAAAPFGSPSILPISWVYIALMGSAGLKRASQIAILNANHMAGRLQDDYTILYTGEHGRVAHEFILDCRAFKESAGIDIDDIAKRLMDYGFHAPTMSWPVPGTLMVEPTESESKAELDRLCDALISIRAEIRAIASGAASRTDNLLKNAPHTAAAVAADHWPHAYSRRQAAYPAAWLRETKVWPPVGRIDNVYGDRHPICTCPSMESFAAENATVSVH